MRNSIKIHFAIKMLTKYFFYGYVCLLGIGLLFATGFFLYRTLVFPLFYLAVVPLFFSIPVFAQFFKIILSMNYKFRYYKMSIYRLKTRGYKKEYFECEMHEPCFRLMIRDILTTQGYYDEYFALRKNCRYRNIRVEKAKEQLLERVKKEHVLKNIAE